MEKDDEVKGAASSLTTEFRQYDSRLGRWLTLDPIEVAFESPYAAFRNNPIVYNDQNGDCPDCNGFTTPAGKLMYASNKHYLWDQKGELVETADGVVHRINAQGINYLWDQKLEGYYDSKGEKYSNPDSSWYDGLVLGFSEMGKDSKDLGKAIIDNPGGTLENMILGGMRTFDTYLSPTTSDEQENNRNLEVNKFKEMNGEEHAKTFTKLIYGIIGSKAIPKTKI